MIYASTRSNLKQQLGANFFSDEVFGTVASDFSKKGYEQHVTSKKMEAPLTEQEQLKVVISNCRDEIIDFLKERNWRVYQWC